MRQVNLSVVETVKRIRISLGLTQAELAKEINSSQAAISEYEGGVKIPSLKVAQKLIKLARAKKIKVTLMDIFPE